MPESAERGTRQERISPRIEEGADYYARLGVSSRASQAEIVAAFKGLSKQFHPDANGGGDEEEMKLISEAYATLKDPEKRAEYDVSSRPGIPGGSGMGAAGGFTKADIFRNDYWRDFKKEVFSNRGFPGKGPKN